MSRALKIGQQLEDKSITQKIVYCTSYLDLDAEVK